MPNRNVVFNVARTFEKLKRFADAHRWYVQALEGEADPAAKGRVEESLKRLEPYVAVLAVESDPPGATVYVDRKDLGPRGSTPRLLAFPPGTYRVLLELDGHTPAASEPVTVKIGQTAKVSLKLERILGSVRVEGGPPGAVVRVGNEQAAPAALPATLDLAPGRHTLLVSAEGFRTARVPVDVEAKRTTTVRPELSAITGTLVVDADEADALVEVDGKPMGFAPVVLQVPVGTRKVRVTKAGFRPVEQELAITADAQARLDAALRLVEEVTAASRATESVEDAPASVTILPSQELRALAYPTLAEALRGVRGLYVSDDRSYATVGVRGLARPGDYGNRVLVLLDGMPTNDDWIGSSYVGYDLRTDLEDVRRIEVVRGAGSVLYGTGAVSGVVNLVPRGPEREEGVEASLSAVDHGVGRARVSGMVKGSDDVGFWTSVSAARGMGRDFEFPELADPVAGITGEVEGLDGFDAGTVTGRGWAGDFNLQYSVHVREKFLPTAPYGARVGDPRTKFIDGRGLVELRHEPELSRSVSLLSRVFANHYRFRGDIGYAPEDGGLAREAFFGTWFGLEERLVLRPIDPLRLTVGGEGQVHTRVHQEGRDDDGTYLDRDDPYQIGAGYLLVDLEPSDLLKVSAGARLDAYSTFGSSLNPRAAVIVHALPGNTVKLLGGKAFRAPSIYELYYTAFTQAESPDLGPETMYTGELEVSQRLDGGFTAVAAGFGNYIEGLVVSRGEGTEADPLHYVNSEFPILTLGGEAELRREWRQGAMLAVTYSYQRSRYQDDGGTLGAVPNSPEHLASLKGAAPLLARAVTLATRLSFEGKRADRFEEEDGAEQRYTEPALVWDVVFSGKAERHGLSWAAGLYNAFDHRYEAPVSAEHTQRTVVQNGRTVLVSATLAL